MHYDSVERAWSVNGAGGDHIYIYISMYIHIYIYICIQYISMQMRYVLCRGEPWQNEALRAWKAEIMGRQSSGLRLFVERFRV